MRKHNTQRKPRQSPASSNSNPVNGQDPDRSLPDKDKVLIDLTEMGYQLNRYGGYERLDEKANAPVPVTMPVLTTRIIDHRQRQGRHPVPKERILDVLVEHSQDRFEQLFLAKISETNYVAGTPNRIEDICRSIAGPGFHPLYPAVLNHVGWCVKRRTRGLEVKYPLLVNLSGPEECGKSFLVQRMFRAVLPEGFHEELKDSGQVLSNLQKYGYLFTERLGVILGEMANMPEVSIDTLKDLIDAPEIHYRIFRAQTSAKGPNRAQLIGTSNKHIREILQRDENIRKYCNLAYDECPRDERVGKRWPIIETFDWCEWLRSIDEMAPSPLEAVYHQFKTWAKADCYRPTDSEVWLSGFIHKYPGSKVQFADLWSGYQRIEAIPQKAKLGAGKFQQLLLRVGCVKHVVSGRMFYELPSAAQPLDGWEAYFPPTIDEVKEKFFGLKKVRE
jgi:hypothetical protein